MIEPRTFCIKGNRSTKWAKGISTRSTSWVYLNLSWQLNGLAVNLFRYITSNPIQVLSWGLTMFNTRVSVLLKCPIPWRAGKAYGSTNHCCYHCNILSYDQTPYLMLPTGFNYISTRSSSSRYYYDSWMVRLLK